MQANFDLIITADTPNLTAELELRDAHGNQLAYRLTEFKGLAQARGLFDLRDYLRNYVVLGEEPAAVAEIGVCIAEQVLGAEIFKHLYASKDQRTLRIQLPGATEEGNPLAAALARVPWEIARPAADQPSLGERNLLVRVVHQMNEPATQPLAFSPNESLRVLFVFAEAPGSRPLAARLERRALRQLFEKEIYPSRRIEAHFLTHGVTRARLRDQIRQHGGYHLVHWSGHGHLNLLELAKAGGGCDRLSGDELLRLFVDAGALVLSTAYAFAPCGIKMINGLAKGQEKAKHLAYLWVALLAIFAFAPCREGMKTTQDTIQFQEVFVFSASLH